MLIFLDKTRPKSVNLNKTKWNGMSSGGNFATWHAVSYMALISFSLPLLTVLQLSGHFAVPWPCEATCLRAFAFVIRLQFGILCVFIAYVIIFFRPLTISSLYKVTTFSEHTLENSWPSATLYPFTQLYFFHLTYILVYFLPPSHYGNSVRAGLFFVPGT